MGEPVFQEFLEIDDIKMEKLESLQKTENREFYEIVMDFVEMNFGLEDDNPFN